MSLTPRHHKTERLHLGSSLSRIRGHKQNVCRGNPEAPVPYCSYTSVLHSAHIYGIVEYRGGSCWSKWKKPIWLMRQLWPFWGVTLTGSCKENLNGQIDINVIIHPSCVEGGVVQNENIYEFMGSGKWPGQLVSVLKGKRLDDWLQQDLGQKYIDGYRGGKTEYEDLCFICQCPWKRIHFGRDT